jgi:hypothetical protein
MEQLIFHGKKTVPAALRRDMWTPYFSIHFPPTVYGAEAGKLAYQRLRELSLQRQLSPPRKMVEVAQRDIDGIKAKHDPLILKDLLENRDLVLPKLRSRLPQKLLAKRLMDQKATSVADVRFVLGLYLEGQTPAELRRARMKKFKSRMAQMGRRAKTRLQKIRQLEARKRDLIRLLASEAQSVHPNDGHMSLTKHAAARISSEYLGYSKVGGGLKKLAKIEAAKEAKATEAELRESMADVQAQIDALLIGEPLSQTDTVGADTENAETIEAKAEAKSEEDENVSVLETPAEQELMVKMMWADERDSAYASQIWPERVIHGSLERWAVSKESGREVTRTSRSIHVIGGEQDSLWAHDPEDASKFRQRTEATYMKRQDAAKLVDDKMSEAIQILRAEVEAESLEDTTRLNYGELMEELQRDETRLAADEQDRNSQCVALEQQWWALAPEERKGVDRELAILLSRVLRLREFQPTPAGETDVVTRQSVASQSAAKARSEDGVEIDSPKSSWFDRVKAMVWRR